MEGGLPFDMNRTRYNQETEGAILEAKAILEGKQIAKRYTSTHALFSELDAELEAELSNKK